jgi:hypothetical protein
MRGLLDRDSGNGPCDPGVTLPEVLHVERRDRNHFGVQMVHCLAKCGDVPKAGDDGKVDSAAEFSGAVRYAGLASHEHRPHAVRADRRKDFEYRVRDQVSPLKRGTNPAIFRSPATLALRDPRRECAARSALRRGVAVHQIAKDHPPHEYVIRAPTLQSRSSGHHHCTYCSSSNSIATAHPRLPTLAAAVPRPGVGARPRGRTCVRTSAAYEYSYNRQ